jgi:GAF domain-containing protein
MVLHGLVFGAATTQAAAHAALGSAFDLDLVTDGALARRYLETKPYALVIAGLEDRPAAVEVLRHATTIIPNKPRIVVGEKAQLLALGPAHGVVADHHIVAPFAPGELAALVARATRPAAEQRLQRCWFAAQLWCGGSPPLQAAFVGLGRELFALDLAADAVDRLRAGVEVTVDGALPFTGNPLRVVARVQSAALRATGAGSGPRLALRVLLAGHPIAEHAGGLDELLRWSSAGVVTILGGAPGAEELGRQLASRHITLFATGGGDALAMQVKNSDVVVLVGPPPAGAAELLRQVRAADRAPLLVAMLSPGRLELPLHYETGDRLSADELSRIVRTALDPDRGRPLAASSAEVNQRAQQLQSLLESARLVAVQTSPGAAATVAAQQLERLIRADRALCYVHDPLRDLLVVADRRADFDREVPAAAGLCGLVVRTGSTVQLAAAGDDPRFIAEIDHPLGPPSDRLLVVPVRAEAGQVVAVLLAARRAAAADFTGEEREMAQAFAGQLGSALRQLSLQLQVADVLKQRHRRLRGQADQLFRAEAMDHSAEASRYGDVLHIQLGWVQAAKYYLAAIVAIALAVLSAARVPQVVAGPAVVELENADDVVASADGIVDEVLVAPDQPVEARQPLVRLASDEERAELHRVEGEWSRLLRQRLENPRDRTVEQRLAALSGELDRARARVEERTLVARAAGVVRAIRVQPGQLMKKGEAAVSVAGGESGGYVQATFPANYRPLISPGMTLDLELAEYDGAHLRLVIDQVMEQVAGPNEVAELLAGGGARRPAARLLVRAALARPSFQSRGETYPLYDGMVGTSRVSLRSRPAILALMPGLEDAL